MTYRHFCTCLVVLIGLFGCGKSDDLFDEASLSASTSSKASSSGVSEPSSPRNPSTKGKVSSGLAKIQALSDEICRCTDDACLDALEGGSKLVLKAFTQEMMDTYQSMDKVPKEIVETVNSARDRAGACAKKLLGPLYRAKRGGKLSEVADKVCACKESACLKSLESVGKQAGDELKAALLAKYKTKEAVPKEILDGIGAALRRMKECEQKLLNPQAPADAAVPAGPAATLTALAEKVCACADKACAQELGKEANAAMKELQKKYPNKAEAPKEVFAAVEAAKKKGGECFKKLK